MIKRLREIMKDTKMKMIVGVCIILILGLISFSYFFDINSNSTTTTPAIKTTTTNIENTKPVEEAYKPTAEEKLVLKKSYEALIGSTDYTVYSDLDKKYDSLSEAKRKNIKTDIERLRKEKDAYEEERKKQVEQNKQLYADLIKEIEDSYPSMKVSSIGGKDDKKSLTIYMSLLHNINATEEQACELSVMKETRMKEIGINDILIFVKDNNGKQYGILQFQLNHGEYKPFLNTLR